MPSSDWPERWPRLWLHHQQQAQPSRAPARHWLRLHTRPAAGSSDPATASGTSRDRRSGCHQRAPEHRPWASRSCSPGGRDCRSRTCRSHSPRGRSSAWSASCRHRRGSGLPARRRQRFPRDRRTSPQRSLLPLPKHSARRRLYARQPAGQRPSWWQALARWSRQTTCRHWRTQPHSSAARCHRYSPAHWSQRHPSCIPGEPVRVGRCRCRVADRRPAEPHRHLRLQTQFRPDLTASRQQGCCPHRSGAGASRPNRQTCLWVRWYQTSWRRHSLQPLQKPESV